MYSVHDVRTALLATFMAMLAAACATDPAYPSCRGDNACQRGGHHEFCIRSHCQQCRDGNDCSGGQICENNRCTDAPVARAECEHDDQCSNGRRCTAGHCVTPDDADIAAHSDNGGHCSFATVHFAFDNSVLDDATRNGLQETARCLEREHTTRYVLVGRADPRGTTEYNLALGQRRADAVQRYLVALGIDASRLGVSSLGSEGATGSNESSWANDRRVDSTQRDAPQGAHGAQ
jgi:peptidoglycan-associated lipoprotein